MSAGPERVVLCTTGNYDDRLREAVRFTETARRRVATVSAYVREQEERALRLKHKASRMPPPTEAQIKTTVDVTLGNDARWKAAVADEQWGCRLVAVYSAIEQLVALDKIEERATTLVVRADAQVAVLTGISEKLDTITELLRLLVRSKIQ